MEFYLKLKPMGLLPTMASSFCHCPYVECLHFFQASFSLSFSGLGSDTSPLEASDCLSSTPLPGLPVTIYRGATTVLQCPLDDKLCRELEATHTFVCAPNAQSNTEQRENALHRLAGKITPQVSFRRSCCSKQTQPTHTGTTTLKP